MTDKATQAGSATSPTYGLWELRYRGPRGVDNVLIEVEGEQTEQAAMELAHFYLDTLANPSVRFVYVRPIIVARTATMRHALKAKSEQAVKDAKKVIDDEKPTRTPQRGNASASASAGPNAGRVGN